MRYTAKELRLIDMFALVLAGLGLLFLIAGVAGLATAGPRTVVVPDHLPGPGKRGNKAIKVSVSALRQLAPFLMATTFLALGAALGVGVRRVIRNEGEDVVDFRDDATASRAEGER